MVKKKRKFIWGSPEHKVHLREAGRKGGIRTRDKKLAENPNYYADIGRIGSMTKNKENYNDTSAQEPLS